jgi:hypothetical protein
VQWIWLVVATSSNFDPAGAFFTLLASLPTAPSTTGPRADAVNQDAAGTFSCLVGALLVTDSPQVNALDSGEPAPEAKAPQETELKEKEQSEKGVLPFVAPVIVPLVESLKVATPDVTPQRAVQEPAPATIPQTSLEPATTALKNPPASHVESVQPPPDIAVRPMRVAFEATLRQLPRVQEEVITQPAPNVTPAPTRCAPDAPPAAQPKEAVEPIPQRLPSVEAIKRPEKTGLATDAGVAQDASPKDKKRPEQRGATLEARPAAAPTGEIRPVQPAQPVTTAHETGSSTTRLSAKPPEQTAPATKVAGIEIKSEVPVPKAAQHLSIEFRNDSDQRVEVRLMDRGGEVRLAVRAADPRVAESLRTKLPELVERLGQQGWRMEGSNPERAVEPLSAAAELDRSTRDNRDSRDPAAPDQDNRGSQGKDPGDAAGSHGRESRRAREAWAQLLEGEHPASPAVGRTNTGGKQ